MEISKKDIEYLKNKKIDIEYFKTFVFNMRQILKYCLDGKQEKIEKILMKYPLNSSKIIDLNDFNLYCLTSKYFSSDIKLYDFNDSSMFDYNNDSLLKINELLNKNGIYIHDKYISDELITNIVNSCNGLEYWEMNNKKKNIILNEIINCDVGRFEIRNQGNILKIPDVQKIVTDPFILKVCQNYLNANPILVQTNFWITNGKEEGYKDKTHEFHQDNDDLKFLKVFIYLNDVNMDNGPHCYVKGSINNLKLPEKYKMSQRLSDDYINQQYGENVLTLTGNKGTIIFENTYGFHKGCPIKSGYRLILQLQFASSTSFFISKYLKPIKIISDEETNKYIEFRKKYPICGIFFYN